MKQLLSLACPYIALLEPFRWWLERRTSAFMLSAAAAATAAAVAGPSSVMSSALLEFLWPVCPLLFDHFLISRPFS